MLPDGVRPSPPMRPAHRSEMMSPYRLGMTIMSNSSGALISCITAESMIISSYLMLGNLSALRSATVSDGSKGASAYG